MSRRALRIIALVIALATLLIWLATGANRGWTKTSVPVEKVDEITGLTYREYEKTFLPGIEALAAGLALAAVPMGVSFLVGRRKSPA